MSEVVATPRQGHHATPTSAPALAQLEAQENLSSFRRLSLRMQGDAQCSPEHGMCPQLQSFLGAPTCFANGGTQQQDFDRRETTLAQNIPSSSANNSKKGRSVVFHAPTQLAVLLACLQRTADQWRNSLAQLVQSLFKLSCTGLCRRV
eukprot:CAMPEP_0114554526 /NCGR_PEP_ID=MMETSP0114-20121206/8256_1 /TAXON_ID=31324 /ORGANISM="Goniomonas sp, Strain m" /LENGTH=147 /DNA_ID=CAMNT_0001739577 /DNA_START=330 /DNA_END=774 /DNA_ORIENTATION=-